MFSLVEKIAGFVEVENGLEKLNVEVTYVL